MTKRSTNSTKPARRRGRPASVWTDERLALLRAHYGELRAAGVAELLGLTIAQVQSKAAKLGLRTWMGRRSGGKAEGGGGKNGLPSALPLPPSALATSHPSAEPRPRSTSDELRRWRRWIRGGRRDDGLRNELLAPYVGLVEARAWKLHAALPATIDLADLVQEGVRGMLDAARRFDPERGLQFNTFAQQRIDGAMRDWIRSVDHIGRGTRAAERQVAAAREALSQRLGREASDEEVADELGDGPLVVAARIPRLDSLQRLVYEEQHKPLALADVLGGRVVDQGLDRDEAFRELLRGLSLEEQTLVYLYFARDATMKAIGAAMQLSESRVSQMMSALPARLRRRGREALVG